MKHSHSDDHDHHHHHPGPAGPSAQHGHGGRRGWGGRGERGRGGHGGPGRFFDSSDLRYLILHLVSDTPRHGYEIIKLIEGESGGAHSPSPGIVYPTLTMLEEMGLAAVTVDGTRKLYAITEEGKRDLEANRGQVDALLARMREAGERHAHDRPAPILRAMENLKLVLRMRSA
ncbi:MAG TPA: PadR family transcriptional regulator, partial [Tepidisphaeraceae bacterium]|nr:PadR family transcriptional regulator [Tepidisphaeraceae bacterium]